VDGKGCLDLEKLEDTIKNEIALVSIIWAHNETGILSPVQEIAELCNREGIPLHLDAVQAVGKIPVDVTEVKCDFLSISAHKFHGPKGVGALFIRDGIGWHSRQIGGGQEKSRRAGTEAVPNIIGLGKASEIAAESLSTNSRKVSQMRDSFESAISKKFSFAKIIGKETPRLPNTSNICFDGFEAETLLPLLDMRGICVSHGAACSSGSWGPPRVLKEMGLNENLAKGSVRFSWGKFNKKEELSEVSSALKEVFHILK
jgi:cysteine desulfurase